jgi:hypothetical protein
MRDGHNEDNEDGDGDGSTGQGTRKNGPRDIVNVSWATGKFFLFFISFCLLLTNVLGTSYLQG